MDETQIVNRFGVRARSLAFIRTVAATRHPSVSREAMLTVCSEMDIVVCNFDLELVILQLQRVINKCSKYLLVFYITISTGR